MGRHHWKMGKTEKKLSNHICHVSIGMYYVNFFPILETLFFFKSNVCMIVSRESRYKKLEKKNVCQFMLLFNFDLFVYMYLS